MKQMFSLKLLIGFVLVILQISSVQASGVQSLRFFFHPRAISFLKQWRFSCLLVSSGIDRGQRADFSYEPVMIDFEYPKPLNSSNITVVDIPLIPLTHHPFSYGVDRFRIRFQMGVLSESKDNCVNLRDAVLLNKQFENEPLIENEILNVTVLDFKKSDGRFEIPEVPGGFGLAEPLAPHDPMSLKDQVANVIKNEPELLELARKPGNLPEDLYEFLGLSGEDRTSMEVE